MGRPGRDQRAARERVTQIRAQQQARQRRRTVLIWTAIAVTVAVIGAAIAFAVGRSQGNEPSLAGVKSFTVSQGHLNTPVPYEQTPPVGGQHAPVWLNCGVYSAPVPNENAVHSLEHGAVWVTYRPDLPTEQVAALREAMPSTYAILSPYPGLQAPVVASAWGKQLELAGANDPRLPLFIRQYRQGPQTPEPGALCTGGVGGNRAPGPVGSGS